MITSSLYSQDTSGLHPVDRFLDSCTAINYSTIGMIECINEANKMWDAEMNKYYKLLEGFSDKETFEKLRDSQREWMKFRDSEIVFINSFYAEIYNKMGGGTIYSLLAASDKSDLVRRRALVLKGYYESATGLGN
jgi:uncharacterized protein YecT (DUF1311 family)